MKKVLTSLLFFACTQRHKFDPDKSELVREPLPSPAGTSSVGIRQIRGTGPDDVWAIALSTVEGRSGRERYAQAYHFDGKAWSYVEVPPRVTAIAPVAKDDVWAAGRYGTIAHWNGREWHVEKLPVDWDIFDVVAVGGQVWVTESGPYLRRFDGKKWEEIKPEVLADQRSLQFIYGVGDQLFVPDNYQKRLAIARYDGKEWRRETVGRDRGVSTIAGSGPDDIWGFADRTEAWHFDGKTWHRFDTPATQKDYVIGAAVASPTEAWAVGENGLVIRWDGRSWRRVKSGTKARFWAAWAAAGGPVFIGGDLGMFRAKR